MKKSILLSFLLSLMQACFFAQANVPMIRANSRNVSVLDGDHFRNGYWYIMPELKLDYYVVENPKQPHKVTFYTDLDTISFVVRPNETHDFVILLNGKDSCLTRLSTVPPKPLSLRRTCQGCNTDTIPFKLGLDNKTYIQAQINAQKTADFLFDLGATGCIIKESYANNCKVAWDGNAQMGSASGNAEVKTSAHNQVTIQGMTWDSIGMFSTKRTNWGSKGILGNTLLQDQILELNYDLKILVFHRTLPTNLQDYIKVEMQMRDGVPFVPVTLDNGKTQSTQWYMFDNAYDNALLVDKTFASANNLYDSMPTKGHHGSKMNGKTKTSVAPRLVLGGYALTDVPIELQNPADAHPYDRVLLGNDVLKRFNTIVDYQHNCIYLKPNTLLPEKYGKGNRFKKKVVVGVGSAILIALGVVWYKKRR